MKILFDHQIFSYQKYGGVSKYFCEMISELPKGSWSTSCKFSNNEYVKQKQLFEVQPFFPNKWFRGQGKIMNELNKPYSIYCIKNKPFDVFHQTHFETYCLKALKHKPMVTTFHDMNFANYNKDERMVFLQKKSIERADKIIAVSCNTRDDLVNKWGINQNKIEVIYHGADKLMTDIPLERIYDFPYLLYVGTRFEFKNFQRFYKVFLRLNHIYSDLRLVCTNLPFSDKENKQFTADKIIDKIKHISATELQLSMLYRDAEAFVYPSVYEGFGMPLLEAMLYQCPIALSNTSSFPEIAQDAGSYFDPYNEDEMFYAIKKLLENSELKKTIIKNGNARVSQFSWEKTAKQHFSVYQSLI
ncbi:MAG: glycosyltransferase family 1 protein [Paludibacter sp.]